jgi:WD40 repeat protein
MPPALRCTLAGLLAASLMLPAVALAERTRFWRQSSYEDFEKGTAEGIALRSNGQLVLAPRFVRFADPNSTYLWALAVDSKGTVYAGGGSNATVVKFDAKGEPSTVFQAQEMAVQALAIDAKDNLYVGTSPDGKVYRITPKGEQSVFFEPKTKYIWALAFTPSGTLLVATGDKGEIYGVTPEGKGELFYKSEQTHIRAMTFDAKGNLIIGTDPSGLVVRLEKQTGGNVSAFVLYETAKKEVTSLISDRAGNIYVAAVGEKPRVPPVSPVAQPVTVPATIVPGQQAPVAPAQQPIPIPFPSATGGSEVYRIAPDGSPEQLWSARDDLVYALGFSATGKLLLGTGNRGLVIRLEGSNVFSSLAKTAAAQVTAFVQGPSGKVFVGTANPGKVFVLGPDSEPQGTCQSQVYDAKIFSQWGRLTWWGEEGATNGQITFYVRSGNTSNPEKNWSPWAGPYSGADGAVVTSPAARFVQWKAVFKAPAEAGNPNASTSPSISWVSLAYLPKNVAPVIENIVVQNPNIRVQGFAAVQQQQQPVQLKIPQTSTGPQAQPAAAGAPRFEPPPQGFAQKGVQSVLWSARDDNEDELTFALYFRGEREQAWKLLKDKVEQKFYSWDTTAMPDGAYYLKIVASDAASNPASDALTAERISDRFEIDNTPPAVEGLRVELARGANPAEATLWWEAKDSYSPIARVEYSLDASDWRLVYPTDRTSDSPRESYELVLRNLEPGEYTLVVRAFDQFENTASAKIIFRVEPQKGK